MVKTGWSFGAVLLAVGIYCVFLAIRILRRKKGAGPDGRFQRVSLWIALVLIALVFLSFLLEGR